MEKIILKIEGMHCDACKNRLEKALNSRDNIISAKVSLENNLAEIEYEKITKDKIEEYIEDIGFKSLGE